MQLRLHLTELIIVWNKHLLGGAWLLGYRLVAKRYISNEKLNMLDKYWIIKIKLL